MADRTCSIDGCERPVEARGWCHTHYQRWRAHGDPGGGNIRHYAQRNPAATLRERFESKVLKSDEPDGCWWWTAAWDSGGYGIITVDGAMVRAHRVAHELYIGPIPDGLHIDHLCRVRHCVNPAHIEAVTCAENVQRGAKGRAAVTHCLRGHEFDAQNTYEFTDSHGHTRRQCKACRAARLRAFRRAAKRAAKRAA